MALAGACGGAPPAGEVPPIAAERAALRAAERRVLFDEAESAMARGDWTAAARIVAVESPAWPDVFGPLAERIAAAGPPEAVALLGGPATPASESARIRHAYGPAAAETRARQAGATIAQARAVWAGVGSAFVDPVDAPAAASRARARLLAVAADPGVRAAFGALPAPDGEDPPAVIASAVAAGWPAEVAAVEAIDAALAGLDPFTRAVWPAERAGWDARAAGVALGIGVELVSAPDGAVVVSLPAVGGPAWRAGVHAGDRLAAVDGAPPADLAAAQAALAGPPGTSVALLLARDGATVARTVERAAVPEETVTGFRRAGEGWDPWIAEGVAWVRISAFRPGTDEAFDALTEYAAPEVVVLDLRGNGGGDLAAALHVADRFVAEGPLVVLEGPTHAPPAPGPNGELPWNAAAPGHALEGTPAVVLVDGRTASAAEIAAGILRARAGAVILGEPTFGKLRSQALRDDPATGAAWQVTTGRWVVGGVGERVEPDLLLTLTPAERRNVDELVLRRELPAAHPDGTPLRWVGSVARRDLPTLSEDPVAGWALRVAEGLRGR
jgi:carboxyl-terminal processing protease